MQIRDQRPSGRRSFMLVLGAALLACVSVLGIAKAQPASAADGATVVSLTDCVGTPMSKGSRGPCVLSLQHSLAATGIGILEDGDFGGQTEAAVRGFQGGNGLAVDGVAGSATIAALDRAANSPQVAPSGPASSSPPDGTNFTNGVYACGNVTCTVYFSRRATQEINQALNDRNTSFAAAIAGMRICKGDPKFATACAAAMAMSTWLLQGSAQSATNQGACLKVKMAAEMVPYRSGVDNSSSHCVDGD